MPEPVFSADDRITSNQLPAELKGVTDPVKIAQYYQTREAGLREELRRATVAPSKTAVTIEQRVDTSPPAVFSAAEAEAARGTLIKAAIATARAGKPYWDRLETDIMKLMEPLGPEDKVNSGVWETCYHTLVGMNKTKLDDEDRSKAAEATRIAAERSAAPASERETPMPLPVEVTSKILPGLGLTEAQYREGQDRIVSGKWPLTADNQGPRRISIGEK